MLLHLCLNSEIHGFRFCKRPSSGRRRLAHGIGGGQAELEISISKSPPLLLRFGKLARLADSSVVASMGHTSVLATTVSKPSAQVPPSSTLAVDYRQRPPAHARHVDVTSRELVTSAVIDRSIRPLLIQAAAIGLDTHITCSLLCSDDWGSRRPTPDALAINAASAALAISSAAILWDDPVAAVRIGYVDLEFVVNPTRRDMARSRLNLVMSGTSGGKVVMVDAEAETLDCSLIAEAIECGLQGSSEVAKEIRSLSCARVADREEICSPVLGMIEDERCERAIQTFMQNKAAGSGPSFLWVNNSSMHQMVNEGGYSSNRQQQQLAQATPDGGKCGDGISFQRNLPPISCRVDLFQPLHGSSLVRRGQNQVLCSVALDHLQALSATVESTKDKEFSWHYESPPYATNDIGRSSLWDLRRDLCHAALSEKALKSVIPKDFPYMIRVSSEALESDGSLSMANVCGGTLALLDAGVPLLEPVAGMALSISRLDDDSQEIQCETLLENGLEDIQVKIAGTRTGITALQVDVKIPGPYLKVIQDAMVIGHRGICDTLETMDKCLNAPRKDKSHRLPVSEALEVPAHKADRFLGHGGINLRRLTADTGVRVVRPGGQGGGTVWQIFAPNAAAMVEAKRVIRSILDESLNPPLELGCSHEVKITEVKDAGVMVEMQRDKEPVFVPISQLWQVNTTRDLGLEVGQTIQVQYLGHNSETGKVRLSANNRLGNEMETAPCSYEQGSSVESLQLPESFKYPYELRNKSFGLGGGDSPRSKFYIESLKEDRGLHQEPQIQESTEEKSPPAPEALSEAAVFEEEYYALDALLNRVMLSANDVSEAETRLESVKEELTKIKEKYIFLEETGWTNRILAEGFKVSTYEKYIRAVSKKKAVEETLRNSRQTHKGLQKEFEKARINFLQQHELDSDPGKKNRCDTPPPSDLHPGIVKKITGTGLHVSLSQGNTSETVFVRHSFGRTRFKSIIGAEIVLQSVGKDDASGQDVFVISDKSLNAMLSEKS